MPKGGSKKEIMHDVMHRYKHGTGPHIGKSKKIAKSRKQAIAIGLSESGQSRKSKARERRLGKAKV